MWTVVWTFVPPKNLRYHSALYPVSYPRTSGHCTVILIFPFVWIFKEAEKFNYIFLKENGLMILRVSFSGGLFHTAGDPQEVAFRQAVEKINADRLILPGLKLVPEIEIISPHDSFHASKRGNWAWICFLLVSLFNIYMWIGLFGNVIKRYPLKALPLSSFELSCIFDSWSI